MKRNTGLKWVNKRFIKQSFKLIGTAMGVESCYMEEIIHLLRKQNFLKT